MINWYKVLIVLIFVFVLYNFIKLQKIQSELLEMPRKLFQKKGKKK